MKLRNYLVDKVTTYYKTTILIVIAITVVMGYYYSLQTYNNNFEIFFKKNDPLLLQFKKFVEKYGSETSILISFKDENLITNKNIQLIRDLSNGLKRVQGVKSVISLTEIEEIVSIDDTIISRKVIPDGKLSESRLALIKEKINANTLYGNLMSEDNTVTVIFLEIEPLLIEEVRRLQDNITETAQNIAANRAKLYISGEPYVGREMDRLSQQDVMTFTVATGILVFIIILVLFRSISVTIIAAIALLMTQTWGFGFFVLCGEQLNMVTGIMSAIFLAMAVADTVHLLSHLFENYVYNGKSYRQNIVEAVKAIWIPCLLTTLTTCAGFLSFASSTFRPTIAMGIFTATGIFFAFILDVTFIPAMLILMQKRVEQFLDKRKSTKKEIHKNDLFLNALSAIGHFSTRYSIPLTFVFFILIGMGVAGIFKLTFRSNNLDWLPDDNNVKKDYLFVENNIGGIFQESLLITAKGDLDFTYPETIKFIDTIQNHIVNQNKHYFTHSFSITDYLKEYNKIFNNSDSGYSTIPESRTDILDFYYELGDPELLSHLIDDNFREVCLTFMSKWSSEEEGQEVRANIQDYLDEKLDNEFDYSFPGASTLWLSTIDSLKKSQINSFSVAFVLIFFMMLYVCKKIKLTILSILPNVFPILITLGFMGWFDIALDSATIMIASVTLGIAVDDTIHFITWYRRISSIENDRRDAIITTFKSVGKPITITTIVLFLGFGILILGNFQPVRTYGILTACSMVFALIGDLFMLPALIMVFKPEVKPLDDIMTSIE